MNTFRSKESTSFVLNIETDNAAFTDGPFDEFRLVFDRVLHKLAAGEREGTVLDSNGNRIGTFLWLTDEAEVRS